MTKAIILSNGVVKNMTFEEVLKQFEKMINGFAYQALNSFVYNGPEKDELIQELHIQVWEAYRRYNGKNAFSTYLHPRLQHGVTRATQKIFAKKRQAAKGITSLNTMIGSEEGESELEHLLGEEDYELTSVEFRDFMNHLEKTLDSCEKLMLKSLLDKNDFSIQNLADTLGMSRQGANKKYNKFKEKMANMMEEVGYVC
jgi:RNA polymerase sigma factor (sigma-70 family)